ncbi:MAG: seryl-tRNA synthetase [Patescibacteria group bacterium]|nr:seryl-tRNA synthetase [Patescibacteria group bacterium]
MLDIKFIRENKDIVELAITKKKVKLDLSELISADDERLVVLSEVERLRAKQNLVSERMPQLKNDGEKAELIKSMQILKEDLKKEEDKLKEVMDVWRSLMLRVPNVPDISVPDGNTDADNKEVKVWGEKTVFDFKPKDHVEIMTKLDMVDFERGTKVHGFRGYFLKNDGAILSMAIWRYAMDFFGKRGFTPMIAPAIARKEHFFGTGHLPGDAEDLFETQDDDYLSGTAEVPVMGYYSNEILTKADLPKKFLAFSPCYRREAGSHGKDTKGLIRVHEFYKVEQVILCEASHEESVKLHEWLNRNTEEFIESLNIPYHTVMNCGGDLGLGQVKKYDIELWVPGEEKYREISSASYFHDFQTRRFNIRYKDEEGKIRFAHSLNCTAIPTPRILVSLVENFQQADGSIKVPEALVPYLGKDKIS